jgi:hypothetical protein
LEKDKGMTYGQEDNLYAKGLYDVPQGREDNLYVKGLYDIPQSREGYAPTVTKTYTILTENGVRTIIHKKKPQRKKRREARQTSSVVGPSLLWPTDPNDPQDSPPDITWLFVPFVCREVREAVVGDLWERYPCQLDRRGGVGAVIWFCREVIISLSQFAWAWLKRISGLEALYRRIGR